MYRPLMVEGGSVGLCVGDGEGVGERVVEDDEVDEVEDDTGAVVAGVVGAGVVGAGVVGAGVGFKIYSGLLLGAYTVI